MTTSFSLRAIAAWPRVDQLAWTLGTETDPLAPGGGGGGSHWRASTRKGVAATYGIWLSWLDASGLLDPDQPPAARASRERVRAYLGDMRAAGLADHTCATRLQMLGDALRVMAPDADTGFIARASGRLRSTAKPSRNIHAKLRPPKELLDLGLELMRQAEQPTGRLLWKRAIQYRDGLLIALWALRPIRAENLAEIQIDRHLVECGEGHRLTFEGDEHKNGRPYSCAFPDVLQAHLARYVEHYRPLLLAKAKQPHQGAALWISQFGRGMPTASVSQIIELATLKHLGQRLGPHSQRHNIATAYAEAQPERITDVPAMLGHCDLQTSQRHYIRANAMRAGSEFANVVLARRPSGDKG